MAQLYLTQGLFLFLFVVVFFVSHTITWSTSSTLKFTLFSCLLVGHVTKACDILRSIEDFKHKQGMVRFAVLSSPILCSFKKVAEIICEVTYLCHAGFCPGHNVHTWGRHWQCYWCFHPSHPVLSIRTGKTKKQQLIQILKTTFLNNS